MTTRFGPFELPTHGLLLGVGSMGGIIMILSRGMGERLTYGIPARYRVVLVECLEACSSMVPEILSLVIWVCTAASLS